MADVTALFSVALSERREAWPLSGASATLRVLRRVLREQREALRELESGDLF
jgi:hypothetical protein